MEHSNDDQNETGTIRDIDGMNNLDLTDEKAEDISCDNDDVAIEEGIDIDGICDEMEAERLVKDDKNMEEDDESSSFETDNNVEEIANSDQEKVKGEDVLHCLKDEETSLEIVATQEQLCDEERTDDDVSGISDNTIQSFDLNRQEDVEDASETISSDCVSRNTENPEESLESNNKTDDVETRNELDINKEQINEENENSFDYGAERVDQNIDNTNYEDDTKCELIEENVNECNEENEDEATSVASVDENCQLRNEIENDFDNIENLLKAKENNNPNQEDTKIEDTDKEEFKEKISDDNCLPYCLPPKDTLDYGNSEMDKSVCDNDKPDFTGNSSDLAHENDINLKVDYDGKEQPCSDEEEDNADSDGLKLELHRVASEKEALEKRMSHIKNQLDRLSRDFEVSVAKLIDVKQELLDLTTTAADNQIVLNADIRNEITKEIDMKATIIERISDVQEMKIEENIADFGNDQNDNINVRIEVNEENTISPCENDQTETGEANKSKANSNSDNEEGKRETKGVMKKLRGRIQGVFKGESFKRTKDKNNSEKDTLEEGERILKGAERKKKKRKRTKSITEPIIRKRRDGEREKMRKQNKIEDQKKTEAAQANFLNVEMNNTVERKESIVALVANSTKVVGIGSAIENTELILPDDNVSPSSMDSKTEEDTKVLDRGERLIEEQKDRSEDSDSPKTEDIESEDSMSELIEPVLIDENLLNKEIDRKDNIEPLYSLIDEINRVLKGENNEENEMASPPSENADDSGVIEELIEAKDETFEEAFDFHLFETPVYTENDRKFELDDEVGGKMNDLNLSQQTDVVDFVEKAYAEMEATDILIPEASIQSEVKEGMNDCDTYTHSHQLRSVEVLSTAKDENGMKDDDICTDRSKKYVDLLDVNNLEKCQITFDVDVNSTVIQKSADGQDLCKNIEFAENADLLEYQTTPSSDPIESPNILVNLEVKEKLELAENLCPDLVHSKTTDEEEFNMNDQSACEHIYAQIEVVKQETNVNDDVISIKDDDVISMENDDIVIMKDDAVTRLKDDDDDETTSNHEELEKVISDEILGEIELSAIEDQLDEVGRKEEYLVEMNFKENEEKVEDLRKLKFEQEIMENKLKLTNEELEKYTDKNKELKNELNKTKDFLSDVIMKKQANERELIKVKQRLKKVVFIRQRFENEFEEVELDFESIPVEEEDTFELLEEENEFLDNFLREEKGSSPKTQKEYRILKKRILEVVEQMIEDLEKLNQNLPPGNRFFGRRKESMRREIMRRLQSRLKNKLISYVN